MAIEIYEIGETYLSHKDMCEVLVKKNYDSLPMRKFQLTAFVFTLICFFILYYNFKMVFSDNQMYDVVINAILFIVNYSFIAIPLICMRIATIERIIYKNFTDIFNDVSLRCLRDGYNESLEMKIQEQELLGFLQKYKK